MNADIGPKIYPAEVLNYMVKAGDISPKTRSLLSEAGHSSELAVNITLNQTDPNNQVHEISYPGARILRLDVKDGQAGVVIIPDGPKPEEIFLPFVRGFVVEGPKKSGTGPEKEEAFRIFP